MKTKKILCIDGGGVNGYFDIEILRELQSHVDLFDIFDMVVGVSSSSAIVANIALDREVSSLLNYDDIFDKNKGGEFLFKPIYRGLKKKNICKNLFGDILMKDIKKPIVIVCSTLSGEPVCFNNFQEQFSNIHLHKVINASSAVPVYFPPVKIDKVWYTDGGLISNNPILAALEQSKILWGQDVKTSIFSIGRSSKIKDKIPKKISSDLGLIDWLDIGVLTNKSEIASYIDLIIHGLLGKKNYLRIQASFNSRFNDTSYKNVKNIKKDARKLWTANEKRIFSFLSIDT